MGDVSIICCAQEHQRVKHRLARESHPQTRALFRHLDLQLYYRGGMRQGLFFTSNGPDYNAETGERVGDALTVQDLRDMTLHEWSREKLVSKIPVIGANKWWYDWRDYFGLI